VNLLSLLRTAPEALLGRADRKLIAWGTARFADRALEQEYHNHLIEHELPKERFINLFGIGLYVVFGFLDILSFKENLAPVLVLRWGICTPLALALILLTFRQPFKQHFQFVTAAIMAIGSLSVVWMIASLPIGGPPYIIGILTVFIFYSCITRVYFVLATSIFLTVLTTYAITITVISPKSAVEISSGIFFMFTIAVISFMTSYMQEIRARVLFHKSRQRELDAAYIKELLIEATAADQSKINFLSVLSHELRTPLHQIIGFCEVSMKRANETGESEMQEFLTQIHTSAHKLLSQIAKMLRYADATAGKIRYHVEKCPVSELIESVCVQAESKAESSSVAITVGDVAPATLCVDPMNASYALGHIVENAINASKEGSQIIISGRKEADGDYLLEVRDFGIGMTAEKISMALAPFAQVESFRTRSSEGVGLGLALARKILNDQDAEITLDSEPGRGTTVRIKFVAGECSRGERRAAA
jgi:signal transduction histidine kinase